MSERLETVLTFEKDTKNTRRYSEEPGAGAPVLQTLYVQKWAAQKLGGGKLPERIRVTIELVD